MSKNIRSKYSPFFKVKKFFKFLYIVGFPLGFADEELNEFEFNPWIQYPKFIFWNGACLTGFVFSGCMFMKASGSWNLWNAFKITTKGFGFSGLDMAVMVGNPFLSLASCCLYFLLFTNGHDKLSKICRLLTDVNEDMDKEWKCIDAISKTNFKSLFTNTLLVGLITILSGVTLGSSYIAMFFSTSTDRLSTSEKVLFCVFNLFTNPTLVYPTVSFSSDFIFSHIVFEVSVSYSKLKDYLKSKCLSKQNHIRTEEMIDDLGEGSDGSMIETRCDDA